MSAEAEAGEILVRIMGQGISEMVRLSGQGAMVAGRAAVSLMTFCYALKVGGSPAEIARNPGGMAIITIPEESLLEFRKATKAYKLKFFTVNSKDYDQGYLDICMKTEDVATCQRILELTGVAAIQTTGTTTLGEEEFVVKNSKTFEDAAEKLKQFTQTPEECFNRHTENDYSRDEPYVVCDRKNPENYVIINPQKAVYDNKPYTKSTYTTFLAGEQTGIFNDEKFAGRDDNYWSKTRGKIVKHASLPENDIIYFKTIEAHEAYKDLAKGKVPDSAIDVNLDGEMKDIVESIASNLEAAGISKKVPVNAQATDPPIVESENGQKIGNKEAKNLTATKTTEPSFEEKAEALKAKSQTFDSALNRRTEKDFSRDQPYAICDRMNPTSYIIINPQKAVHDSKSYTKSTYQVYRNGEPAGVFKDGKFDNRDKYFWGKLKDQMRSAGGFENDLVYFKDLDSLRDYQNLYQHQTETPQIAMDIAKLANNAIEKTNEVSGTKSKTNNGGVREFTENYKKSHSAPDPELSKIIKEKMTEMGVKK